MALSEPVLIAIIGGVSAAIPIVMVQIANVIIALRTDRKVDAVKKNTDGLTSQRVQAEGDKQLEIGKAVGVEAERVRAEANVPPT